MNDWPPGTQHRRTYSETLDEGKDAVIPFIATVAIAVITKKRGCISVCAVAPAPHTWWFKPPLSSSGACVYPVFLFSPQQC